jgi:hypothetical protein
MIHQHSSDIIQSHHSLQLPNGEPAEALVFHNALTLVVSEHTLAMFKTQDHIQDPLGNGLIASVQLTEKTSLAIEEGKLVKHYQSGFVSLVDGKALLITPNVVQLFGNANDALRNQQELARLVLG